METKKVLTSSVEFSRTILSAQTPDIQPNEFTKAEFLNALSKVSRRQEPPAAPPEGEPEKPKE